MIASLTDAAGPAAAGPGEMTGARSGRGRRPLHGFTLIELLVVIAIISLLVSILLPSLQQAKDLAKLAVCSGNMHALGLSMHVYAEENDEELPSQFAEGVHWWQVNRMSLAELQGFLIDTDQGKPSGNFMTSDNIYIEHFRTWMDDLFLYNESVDAYRCPAARKTNSLGHPLPSYGYAAGLSGYGDVDDGNQSMHEIIRPAETFMFMDSNNIYAPLSNPAMFPEWFLTHGEDEVHMIFVDSHVGMIDAYDPDYQEWRTDVWGWYY